MLKEQARERVARGAALLDKQNPGWYARLDPDTLDMSNCWRCVLGRLYGQYYRGALALGLDYTIDHGPVIAHGFFLEGNPGDEEYRPLIDAWCEAIANRRWPTVAEGKTVDAVAAPSQVSNA